MRAKRNKHIKDEAEMQMTPMIDIVFQLLIFFLLSAKFIALEGQLSSYLPKDRGLQSTFSQIDLANITFFLDWIEDVDRVRCRTLNYVESDGSRTDTYEFGNVDGRASISHYGPPGEQKRVLYGYQAPDFDRIEEYLRQRHQTYTGGTTGVPVTINVGDTVPMQMVANIVDICARIGITNVTIAAKEQPIE